MVQAKFRTIMSYPNANFIEVSNHLLYLLAANEATTMREFKALFTNIITF
jgi:hypothetical protein